MFMGNAFHPFSPQKDSMNKTTGLKSLTLLKFHFWLIHIPVQISQGQLNHPHFGDNPGLWGMKNSKGAITWS